MKHACLAAVILLCLSCGIEDYPYIYPISSGIQVVSNNYVSIYIPGDNNGNAYFTNYVIYYRIYISNENIATILSENEFSTINTSLNSDHSRVRPYIGNDSMGSSSIESIFKSINYYPLSLEGSADIDHILSSNNSVFNKYLVLDFSRDSENESIPYMTLGAGPKYSLVRSKGSGSNYYELKPDNGYFINSHELLNQSNIDDSTINGDVTDKPNADKLHTYVSMYIIASGFDSQTFIPLYSSPAHIGVFYLPDPN